MCLYSLRHSGASHDYSEGTRSLAQIQAGGQWRTFTSVMRYSKAGRLAMETQHMTMTNQQAAAALGEGLGYLFEKYAAGSFLFELGDDQASDSSSSWAAKHEASRRSSGGTRSLRCS